MSVKLDLELEQRRLAPGDEVRGRVRVTRGGKARSIAASLTLIERTADYKHATPWAVESGPLHSGPVEAGRTFPFALRVPPDAPPGHRSTHGRLVWVVTAVCDQPGVDATIARELEVISGEALDRRQAAAPTVGRESDSVGSASSSEDGGPGADAPLGRGALIALIAGGWVVVALVVAAAFLL